MGKSRKISLPMTQAAQRINKLQSHLTVKKLGKILGSLHGKTIGVLGLAFKPESDDMREAPSLELIHLILEQGCTVKAYDPVAIQKAAQILPDVTYCPNAYEVARGSDALVLVTEWDEFRELNMSLLASLMKHPFIIDGRNIYDAEVMREAGFIYEGIGRHAAIRGELPYLLVNVPNVKEPVLSGGAPAIESV